MPSIRRRPHGLLGDHLFGTDFSFHILLMPARGAYICGEETALIDLLEGKRGMPRAARPIQPPMASLGKPTVVNNVETLAQYPAHPPQRPRFVSRDRFPRARYQGLTILVNV